MIEFATNGSVDSVYFNIRGDGGCSIHGQAPLEEHCGSTLSSGIENIREVRKKLTGATCGWTIANSLTSAADADGLGLGVWDQFHNKSPNRSLAQVIFYDESDGMARLLSITVIMPDKVFDQTVKMFHSKPTDHSFRYRLSVRGYLRNPMAKTTSPTVNEFLSPELMEKKAIITEDIFLRFESINPE